MDFAQPEELTDLAGLARDIAAGRVTADLLAAADTLPGRHHPDLWTVLARAGLLEAGTELGLQAQCAVLVELGRVLAPVAYRSAAVAAWALTAGGTAAQRDRWLAPAFAGDAVLGVVADGDGITARRDGDGWLVDGAADLVTPGARAVLLAARTDDGPVVLAVEPGDDGVQLQAQATVHGDAARLELTGARLPADRQLGVTAADLRRWVVVTACAEQAGVLSGALALAAAYSRERQQFGRPIGGFQAVSQRLGDGWIDVESALLTLWQAAWAVSAGDVPADDVDRAVATAGFWAAEAGHRVAHTGVHVHGGTGIDVSHPMHRYFTAAKLLEFTLGGATRQLLALPL